MATKTDEIYLTSGEGSSKIADISELVRRFCIADGNVSIYGLSHPLAARSIGDAYEFLVRMTDAAAAPVVLNIGEDKLLFEGFPVESRNAQVARLIKRLAKLHVNSLHFLPGITLDEFTAFHELLIMKEEDIEAAGGVKDLIDMAGIHHVRISGSTYVLVEEDQRVIDRNATIAAAGAAATQAAEEGSDAEIIRYMLQTILKESKQKDWLINRIKNDPRKMAALIADGVEKALSDADKPATEAETIQSLIENIKQVGESLMDHGTGEMKDGQEDLKDAVLELEKEIQTRARQLMTTEDSKRFVNEILNVVTTYSDQVKAKRITREFLKGEANLKSTEKLLKSLAGKQETGEQLLLRLHGQLAKAGVKEEEMHRLFSQVRKPSAPRKRRKPADEALRDGIVQRVRDLGLNEDQHPEAVDRLTAFFESRLADREKEFAQEAAEMDASVSRRDHVLDAVGAGVVIWDRNGKVEYLSEPARQVLRFAAGTALGPAAFFEMKKRTFPAPDIPPEEAEKNNWSVEMYRLLTSISLLVTDAQGEPIGAMIVPPAKRPAAAP